MNAGRTKGETRGGQTPEGKHTFLVQLLAELQAIVKQIEPTPNPYLEDGMPVDFRRLSLTLPSRKTVDAALSCIKGGADYEELGRRARRWENDYTQFKIQQKYFHEECQNMDVAEKRRTHGTLSDAPQALEQFRRNLAGDIEWLNGIICGSETAQKPKKDRKRYPQDGESLALLKEAMRRKRSKPYANCSSEEVIKQMMDEESHWKVRILYGKLHGKKGGQGGRERTKPIDRAKAIKTWGKYLSAYIKSSAKGQKS